MEESNIEKYLGIIDLNETDFTNEEILEIIDLYLKQKPYLEGAADEDLIIFESLSEEDMIEEDDSFKGLSLSFGHHYSFSVAVKITQAYLF